MNLLKQDLLEKLSRAGKLETENNLDKLHMKDYTS